MAWVLLFAAGLLEILWAFTMKLSQGFTRVGPTVVTLLAMLASFPRGTEGYSPRRERSNRAISRKH